MAAALDGQTLTLLVQQYLAPAAELLVSAVTPPPVAPTVLCGEQVALLAAVFSHKHPRARYLTLESLPPPALRGMGTEYKPAYGRTYPAPLKAQTVGACVQ